ncbi:hypothetical protein FKW77_008975 [Venturia effusa]|uniref:SET domain-containing protein n=1 Tax=Venturia effusa TaxID=50376 RepID=A0A517KX48_9PEZI|nr:hypothetical protein FKW77_008975 [Venturia effusa]
MKIRLTHFSVVCSCLFLTSHARETGSDICSNLGSSEYIFRQLCLRNRSDQPRDNKEKAIASSSQQFLQSRVQSPHPWSYDPECIFSKSLQIDICVWTDINFAAGRGISIIATPDSATAVAKNKIFYDPDLASTANSIFEPPYEIRQLPGRGFGLIANRTVHRGDKIFVHTPILIAQAITETGLEEEELFRLHRVAVERLPEGSRQLFMALHGHFGGDLVYDRFSTNAFNVFDFAAIFPETARINHDCRPNAGYYFDKPTFTHKVHATREISSGVEITISYIDPFLTSQQRLERIPGQWGFNCSCSLCSSSREDLSASDQRLEQILELESQLQDLRTNRTAKVETAEKLVLLYKEERFETSLAKAYVFAALEHIYVGNRRMAQKFAKLAVETTSLWYGPQSEDVKLMDSIAREPERHRHWKLFH